MACIIHPVSITADCKTISYTVSCASGTASVLVTSPNLTTYTDSISVTGGSGTGTFTTGLAGSQHGTYQFDITDANGEIGKGAVLSACDLDCCITKKTNELLDCDCDCEKCSSLLAQTQKIFIMKQAADYNLEKFNAKTGGYNVAYVSAAQAMYNKILAICNDTCGCDC
tara:strand:- start:253 stop:759 length:507 start_codon:yes stop_codon:yes gene_type:complete